jgi:D-tyrosyl-tRNA(Tyr) deacylase
MIALLQRVSSASVAIEGHKVAEIGRGMLVLVGVARADTCDSVPRALERLLSYRIFPDDAGKMNLNLRQIEGGLLLVPQFTLLADTARGTRPGFSSAGPPDEARKVFDELVQLATSAHRHVAAGRFGADMQVSLVNDGPVTFWLEIH